MTDNSFDRDKSEEYRDNVKIMGKKEFTLHKMIEYGFWPKGLPTPFERQVNETPEQYQERQRLFLEYKKIADEISKLYKEKNEISQKLQELRKQYNSAWDEERIRKDIAQRIMKESKERREQRKKQRELEKERRFQAWQEKKAESIVFIGNGYSSMLHFKSGNQSKLANLGLPIINTDKELAEFIGVKYRILRFLAYHRDVVSMDHYHHYKIPKRKGGTRNIAAPKSILKGVQRKILEGILEKYACSTNFQSDNAHGFISDNAHGFIKGRSVVTGASTHIRNPDLVINMDIEDFFPTITFQRVRGMFVGFGYSGYIASLLAMLCTYCERMEIEINGKRKFVATTGRILPQGSPASPMITNILCLSLDKRLNGLAAKFGFKYTRYADDMSFSTKEASLSDAGKLCGLVSKIVADEGFKINYDKTRFLKKNNCQSITGIVINNEQLGVNKKWVKTLRAALYNARKAMANGKIPYETISEISGMAAWLKNVNEERYATIIKATHELIKEIQKSY
ncbi:MAG TPA: reverse transcriptase domain-containing protein [Pseudobacteroides sp.]|uniref:reverse transcriptase family protein n=1 Tax=Pseudobacteroides sp. TaxID=1968840 RepID=UPI002F92A01E